MKTKNIFKALAFAILMPAMLLTASCVNDEIPNEKGYELPVTINVSRQGDDASTKATYNGTSKKLEFSTGDKLFATGAHATAGQFAGTLTWVSEGAFSGTIITQYEYSGTALDLLETSLFSLAFLLPADYEDYGFLSIDHVDGFNDLFTNHFSNSFALTKATAIEQFSRERGNYVPSIGYVLSPLNAILNFTITDLTASTEYAVVVGDGSYDRGGNVTTNGSGAATFAVGVSGGTESDNITLTVGGTPITLNLFGGTNTELAAGKVYNVTRSAAPAPSYDETKDISEGDLTVIAGEHWLISGTTNDYHITIEDGATVTLDNVYINRYTDDYCIKCEGSATIILKDGSTNQLVSQSDYNYPPLWVGNEGTTLTIQGSTGSLQVTSTGRYCAAIGGGWSNSSSHTCGNIVIEGGVIVATGGTNSGAGIGSDDESTCGSITISGGRVTAKGRGSGAGIGSGNHGDCGDITITDGAAFVEATMGSTAPVHIGPYYNSSSCIVTIDGVVNANTSSTFTHFDSVVSGDTWTLTHK